MIHKRLPRNSISKLSVVQCEYRSMLIKKWWRKTAMKCTIQGCPGEYQDRLIVHTVKHLDEVFVFENVPAEVCDVCSDTLLSPTTVGHIEGLLQQKGKPEKFAPVYEYA
jgi:YgiT-type zinc finger domain-containing protein